MPTILVDYENVNGSNGLKGAGALHKFGREDGRAIYQLLKDKVQN